MTTSQTQTFEGILLIDKPTGMTSHDVVDHVRRKLKMKRIGHAGTLDPMATGLMIILVGKATKASQYLMSLRKEYEATMLLGVSTDSQDADGEVTETREVKDFTEKDILETMDGFKGDQFQTPPMFSAKKINGVPLYKLARKGKEVEREPRFINIAKLELLNFELPNVRFLVDCSKGTYIRTLAHDMGEKLECGAHLIELRRTAIDKFRIDQSTKLDDFEQMQPSGIKELLIPVYKAVPEPVAE